MFKEHLKSQLSNILKFCCHNIKTFIFLFEKGPSPWKYIDDWEKFNELSLSENEDSFSKLNMENITGVDYRHRKRVDEEFEVKHLGAFCVL